MTTRTLLLLGCIATFAHADDLNCLTDAERTKYRFYTQLQGQAYAADEKRSAQYETLKTPDDIAAYQKRLKAFFRQRIGAFPERTPLNPRTVRTIECDGYRIENVMFESRPNHHVTANLYIPQGTVPHPCVVVASGHSRTAKTAGYNQRFGIMMARHGMAALCFDPIGQGERSQILNETGVNRFRGTTTEHFMVGVGSILVGRNTASYMIWDTMRCIDYLETRPEIDAKRIGMTGCSGGGTQTSYAMALDSRIVCAAPSCYLTTLRRLIEIRGPQDAEQNIFGQLAYGMDHPDYVIMRAPRPTLISTTTQDYFSIVGSWENFRQAKRIYGRLGLPERVDLVEIEGSHGVTKQNLATIAHWMKRWLLSVDQPVPAVELDTLPAEQLLCTKRGQVLLMPNERSVFDINADYASELLQSRATRWTGLPVSEKQALVQQTIGAASSSPSEAVVPSRSVGAVQRDGYVIGKYVISSRDGRVLPTLVFTPENKNGTVCIFLHPDGKTDAGEGGPIAKLIESGTTVIAVDLCGQGETSRGERNKQLGDWQPFFLAYQLNQSLVGLRVDDIFAVAGFAKKLKAKHAVQLAAVGPTGILAMHAAALNPDLFGSVTLIDTLRDWTAIIGKSAPDGHLDYTVHGVLQHYDLPDLVDLAGRDKFRFTSR